MEMIEDLKRKFRQGNIATRLIIVNVAVFVAQFLFDVLGLDLVNSYLSLPSDLWQLLWQPLSPISYQFMHAGPMHLLFNMLWLYWFGELFLRYFSRQQLLANYLLGGLSGALLFVLVYALVPQLSQQAAVLVGASAAVTAIGVAVATYKPNFEMPLLLIGPVKLKYLVLVMIALDFFNIQSGVNVGGHFSHLGGAAFGFWFGSAMKRQHDITRPLRRLFDRIERLWKPRPSPMRVQYGKYKNERERDFAYNAQQKVSQAEIDRILEKITRSGYDSLSADERDKLFRASK